MSAPAHVGWLAKATKTLRANDGTPIELWELNYKPDARILSAWAKHFRNHYCEDGKIDLLRSGSPHSRAEYLLKIKFPDQHVAPGPSIRAGDFAEILIADYIEFLLGYWVPRTRYDDKTVRNESKKGSDIIGFRFQHALKPTAADTLLIFESKAQLSGAKAKAILQQAINHSAKDEIRRAESLNAIKQRLLDRQEIDGATKVARFQNPEDNPYESRYGAAALFSSELLDDAVIGASDATKHPHKPKLALIVISGPKLMELVHKLYAIAASEA